MRIALLPPDERPNTGGYAQLIGECAGVEVILPPQECLPNFQTPGDTALLAQWLESIAPEVDHIVASLDLLVHGGLVPSRLTHDSIGQVIPRLDVLRRLNVPITAYQVITRLPLYDNPGRSRQEPAFWATHGQRLGSFSQTWDRYWRGEADAEALGAAREAVPEEYLQELVTRRLRNHTVNLAALELESTGVIDELFVTSDDTAPRGLPVSDRQALERWISQLDAAVRVYPGADEVPSTLIMRVATRARGIQPRIRVACAESAGLGRIAPYEDQPISVTVARQINAAGAITTTDAPDITLVVHAPAATPGDWVMRPPGTVDHEAVAGTVSMVQEALKLGKPVALADVRYANGSDPALVQALDDANVLDCLVAYGGWNTAGNTLGTTIAAAVSATIDDSDQGAARRKHYLAVKIIKDGHYLPVVRTQIQNELQAAGLTDPPLNAVPQFEQRITDELNSWIRSIRALQGFTVTESRMVWDYTFTLDLHLSESAASQ